MQINKKGNNAARKMSNLITRLEDLPMWAQLPSLERLKVRLLLSACREIAAATNRDAAYKAAAEHISRQTQTTISWQTVQRKFLAWHKTGSVAPLVDYRHRTGKASTTRTSDPRFLSYWYALLARSQRNSGQAYESLLQIWRRKTEVIPAYEDWSGWPQLPPGWSKKNMLKKRPARVEISVMREGIKSSAHLLAQVLTTRVGCEAGQFIVSDDNWLDTFVIAGKQIVRPLQLACVDIATGKLLHWGMMPRLMQADGKHAGLSERYMRMFIAGLLATVGINTGKGTVLVVENGTAAIRDAMEQALLRLYDGMVTVKRSPMEGTMQALAQGFGGRAGGNPRSKAHVESLWNLTSNHYSSLLPAPSGHDRKEPEWGYGLKQEQLAILKSQGYLEITDPARALMLRNFMPTFEQLTGDLIWQVYDRLNSRTDHALEGWERAGYVIPMVRYSSAGEWIELNDTIPAEHRHALITMASGDPHNLMSVRRMSPNEAWDMCMRRQSPMRKATQMEIVDLLTPDLATKTRVRGAYIVIQNREIAGEKLQYESTITTPDGYKRQLDSGTDILVIQNILSPNQLYVIDDKGRCLGRAPLAQRAAYYDTDAIKAAMGHKKHLVSAALQPARVHNARHEAEIIETRLINQAITSGVELDPASLIEADQSLRDITPTPGQRSASTRRRNAVTSSDIAAALAPVSAPIYESDEDSRADINISDLY